MFSELVDLSIKTFHPTEILTPDTDVPYVLIIGIRMTPKGDDANILLSVQHNTAAIVFSVSVSSFNSVGLNNVILVL